MHSFIVLCLGTSDSKCVLSLPWLFNLPIWILSWKWKDIVTKVLRINQFDVLFNIVISVVNVLSWTRMETHWEGLEYLNRYIYLTRGTTFWLVSMGSDEVNTLQSKLVFSICALHYNAQKRNDAYLISNDHMYVSKNKQCPGPIIMTPIRWNSISYIRTENIYINVIISSKNTNFFTSSNHLYNISLFLIEFHFHV